MSGWSIQIPARLPNLPMLAFSWLMPAENGPFPSAASTHFFQRFTAKWDWRQRLDVDATKEPFHATYSRSKRMVTELTEHLARTSSMRWII